MLLLARLRTNCSALNHSFAKILSIVFTVLVQAIKHG